MIARNTITVGELCEQIELLLSNGYVLATDYVSVLLPTQNAMVMQPVSSTLAPTLIPKEDLESRLVTGICEEITVVECDRRQAKSVTAARKGLSARF